MVSVSACGGDRSIASPPPEGGGSDGASLTVHAAVDAESEMFEHPLGWDLGVVGARVFVLRNGTATLHEGETDAVGDALFEQLLPGLYRVYATRRLTLAEGQGVGSIHAFADGGTFKVQDRPMTVSLEMASDRGGGLVISEINPVIPPPWETGGTSYHAGQYFELYNDSEQVHYLDGMLFGSAYHLGFRDYESRPCSSTQSVRADAEGIHAGQILRFPGSGSEYPIFPGEAKLIAIGAIDHTPVHPWLLDLTGANFEIEGAGVADNPAVPDLSEVGPIRFLVDGVVPPLTAAGRVLFLAEPTDVSALPVSYRDFTGRGYVRIPAAQIVDVAALDRLWPDNDVESPPCDPMVSKRFDRYPDFELEIGLGVGIVNLSYERVGLSPRADVRLQDTNTSAADFELAPHTPGTIGN